MPASCVCFNGRQKSSLRVSHRLETAALEVELHVWSSELGEPELSHRRETAECGRGAWEGELVGKVGRAGAAAFQES